MAGREGIADMTCRMTFDMNPADKWETMSHFKGIAGTGMPRTLVRDKDSVYAATTEADAKAKSSADDDKRSKDIAKTQELCTKRIALLSQLADHLQAAANLGIKICRDENEFPDVNDDPCTISDKLVALASSIGQATKHARDLASYHEFTRSAAEATYGMTRMEKGMYHMTTVELACRAQDRPYTVGGPSVEEVD